MRTSSFLGGIWFFAKTLYHRGFGVLNFHLSLQIVLKDKEVNMSIDLNHVAPDFEASDWKGESFKLSEFKGKKNVFLIFNRGFV
jgi:peroxiredoxin Q/BCP